MDYRYKFLAAFGLILLLLVGKISILTENDLEKKERNQSMPDDDICTLYDYSLVLDQWLFRKNYKPLIVTIARKFTDGISRVRNISQSKRILYDNEITNKHWSKMHNMITENFYLYEAHNVYYFVYPVNILNNSFTIYCQKRLLTDQLGVTFDFVNVRKENPFFEDILVHLKSNCSNCPLVEYVNKKLKTGESFSELFVLREQLFREKTNYTSLKAFDNYYACDSIGFNINSESENFLMHFNTILQQIQKNSNNFDKSRKKRIFDRSLKCFKSRHLFVTQEIFNNDIQKQNLNYPFTGINYLNWINETVFSLNVNDSSFGNICKDEHKIYIFKLFCFIKDVSDITSYDIAAWTDAIQQLVAASLNKQLMWFNSLVSLYQNEDLVQSDFIFLQLENLRKEILNESGNWMSVMNITFNLVLNLMIEKSSSKSVLSSPCLFYNYLDTIDALLPEMEFKRLVIIVADSMPSGVRKVAHIAGRRVVPRIKREDLHYTKQFVYDEIMKHFYLLQSNDTYYYVYPLTENRQIDVLITYFEIKMISDYSKVVFYFANYSNSFLPDKFETMSYNDLLLPALPDNCHLFTTNCENRFLNPIYLINLQKKFHRRYSKYLSVSAMFLQILPKSVNNDYSHYKDNNSIEYAQKFYDFLKTQQISYRTDYLLNDFPCSSLLEINKGINIDFRITEIGDFFHILLFIQSAYNNITSINITDNDNLKYFCMNSNIFQFIKFFCFLKINCIQGMFKHIDANSYYVKNMEKIAQNEKNVITEYLSKTLIWMNEMLQFDYHDMYNKAKILKQLKLSYLKIPKIISNGADSLDKFYLVLRETVFYPRCKNYMKRNSSPLNRDLSILSLMRDQYLNNERNNSFYHVQRH
ncbi:uncharacterized protein LOC122498638 [Leptopilina heterotoma]|uniref:uncharacterized protein LOC122498638 n=1 Tax=Leptopilina heterotoma TaxID=63436 RepID=UPI001CA86EDF|nr:uncharacterized protein LOC122498638 [Leptopilina heterotoma]